jgi:uncharacterized protein YukE
MATQASIDMSVIEQMFKQLSSQLEESTKKLEDNNNRLENQITDNSNQMKDNINVMNEKMNAMNESINKIDDKMNTLEQTMQKAFAEQVSRMECKIKEHFTKCEKQVKEVKQKITHLEERVEATSSDHQHQFLRLHDRMETTNTEVATQSEKVKEMETSFREELERVKRDARRRSLPMVIYPGPVDDRYRVYFKGEKFENPIEFLLSCEKEMEAVGSELTDPEKIDWVAKHLKMSARKWYNIVRDKITSYSHLKEKFEARYWNVHIQRQLRDQLEYGKFTKDERMSPESYVIQHVERAKHLKPVFSEAEIVLKLAYHFNRHLRIAIFTQGIQTVDDLLLLVSQSEVVLGEADTIAQYNQFKKGNRWPVTDDARQLTHQESDQESRGPQPKKMRQPGDEQPRYIPNYKKRYNPERKFEGKDTVQAIETNQGKGTHKIASETKKEVTPTLDTIIVKKSYQGAKNELPSTSTGGTN